MSVLFTFRNVFYQVCLPLEWPTSLNIVLYQIGDASNYQQDKIYGLLYYAKPLCLSFIAEQIKTKPQLKHK